MPTTLDREKIRRHLEDFDLRALFIEELGWDHGGENMEVTVASKTFVLEAVAHKRGLVVYQHVADTDDTFPDHPTRQKIEKAVARTVREHLIVYAPPDRSAQYWQWVKREPGKPDRQRSEAYHQGEAGERLIQKLEHIVFALDEEDDLTIVDVSGRVRAAFDVEKVTRKFYDRFKQEHHAFLDFIEGIQHRADREWYASLMLNRMMFIYFIQKRGFLDNDSDYLRNRLHRMQTTHGKDRFQTFYRLFLLRLFLKLVAQLERYDQIEPLPDVDFNVRAGNTLVGFTSLEEVRKVLSADLIKQLSLPQIEERAEIADRAFRKFREKAYAVRDITLLNVNELLTK